MFSREVPMLDKFLEKSQTIPIIVCMYNVTNNVSGKLCNFVKTSLMLNIVQREIKYEICISFMYIPENIYV